MKGDHLVGKYYVQAEVAIKEGNGADIRWDISGKS